MSVKLKLINVYEAIDGKTYLVTIFGHEDSDRREHLATPIPSGGSMMTVAEAIRKHADQLEAAAQAFDEHPEDVEIAMAKVAARYGMVLVHDEMREAGIRIVPNR